MAYWIDEIVSRCQQRADSQDTSRDLYHLSRLHGEDAFDVLCLEIRNDISYFRAKCTDAEHLLDMRMVPAKELEIWSKPPYSSKVVVSLAGDCISYWKTIRPNPRAEHRTERGKIFVKSSFDHSIWLEHEGERIDFARASEILVKDLLSSLLEKA